MTTAAVNKSDLILAALFLAPITSLEAIRRFGVTRLAAVIYELRQDGFRIESVNTSVRDRFGNDCHVAEYRLLDRRRARSLRVQRIKRAGRRTESKASPPRRPSAPRAAVTGARDFSRSKRGRAAR
jgi:hypothetical protein